VSKVEKEDEAVTVINDTEATTTMDTKAVGTGSIQSWDQVYEALSAKFPEVMADRWEVKSSVGQVCSLQEQRLKDPLVVGNLIDEIKLPRREEASVVLASGSPLAGSVNMVAPSDDEIGQRTATAECNVVKVAQFDGEPRTDATEWLRDFIDKSELACAMDECRLKAAPRNCRRIAKTRCVNRLKRR
jgi:hypothetical protein